MLDLNSIATIRLLWREMFERDAALKSKYVQDIYKISKINAKITTRPPARPGPSPAQDRGRAVSGRPVRGPGLGPGWAGLSILYLSCIYLDICLDIFWYIFGKCALYVC